MLHVLKFAGRNFCFSIMVLYVSGCHVEKSTVLADSPIDLIVEETWSKDVSGEIAYQLSDSFVSPTEDQVEQMLASSEGILTLKEAVAFATRYSHEYRTQQEQLYLQTLNLKLIRFNLVTQIKKEPYEADWSEGTSMSDPSLDLKKAIAESRTTTELAEAWAGVLTGPIGVSAVSSLQEKIGDPLPRHVQQDTRSEELIQGERDRIAMIRSFQRFQQSFVVSILNQYYRILHLQEATVLAEQKLNTLQDAYRQMGNLANVGRAEPHELDRARQDQLRVEDDWIKSQRNYQDALDEFKLLIGIPVHIDFELDKQELIFLRKKTLQESEISLRQGIETALIRRLDLMNQKDNVADRARDVLRQAYDPDTRMDFVVPESGPPWDNDPAISPIRYLLHKCKQDFDTHTTFDQMMDRNTFERNLVQLAQEHRQYQHAVETITKQVRQAHRRLTRSHHRYDVQQQALELAQKRVVNTSNLLENGRASVRDVLRAQEDLFDAKMDATEALVDHSIATLDFYRDSGVLKINPDGRWQIMAPAQ